MLLTEAGKKAIDKLAELVSEFTRRQKSLSDVAYDKLREDARQLLDEYAMDPFGMATVEKCDRLVLQLEQLSCNNISDFAWQRSRTNVAYISAQTKRTHFAAYMAGKWSGDNRIGGAFKAWMHNSAADGALSLYEAVTAFRRLRDGDDAESRLLYLFGEGARVDTVRFLDMADSFFPHCVITRYNRAKLDALTGRPELVRSAINALKSLPQCDNDCHAAELIWHKNLFDSFTTGDSLMKEMIAVENSDSLQLIRERLEQNAKRATDLRERRADDLWQTHPKYGKAVIAGVAVGTVLIAYVLVSGGTVEELLKMLLAHQDALSSQLIDADQIAAGGGLQQAAESLIGVMSAGGGLA